MGLLKNIKAKKAFDLGFCHAKWAIQKRLLKERYNIDWKTPAEKHPEINFD